MCIIINYIERGLEYETTREAYVSLCCIRKRNFTYINPEAQAAQDDHWEKIKSVEN